MKILKTLYGHLPVLSAFAAAALSSLIHGYQIIVQAGGLKNIWRKFLNGNTENKPMPETSTKTN